MTMSHSRSALSAVALLAVAGAAQGGTFSANLPSQNIFGQNYSIDIYRVATDLSAQGLSPASGRLEPEGMVWYNGALHVTGDGQAAETNGYLASYAGGNLGAAPGATRYTASIVNSLGNTVSAGYGPEGIAVNTRGAAGQLGAAAGSFVGIDSVTSPVSTRILATMPAGGGVVTNNLTGPALNYDDITFVPGAATDGSQDRFAVIDASGTAPALTYLDASTGLPTGSGSFPLVGDDKGLLFLTAAQANLFIPGTNQDVLLIARGAPGANALLMYALDGTQLGLSLLPSGTGVGLLAGIESLAFDPATNRLFIGDENSSASQIAVLVVPAPGAGLIVGMAGLVAFRRRR